MITFLLGMLLMLPCLQVKAQNHMVSGMVKDETDLGLPGVSVYVKGTTVGTITDAEGKYTLNNVQNDAILMFQYIGYTTQEIAVGDATKLDIILKEDVQALSEIVVIGYGEADKKDVTGVVTSVDSEGFNKGAIVSSDQLINGKVAGVQITANSGEPGGQTSVRIRGGTSINASNEPLYVIDGVPIDNSAHNPGEFQSGRNPLNSINPNDIETFTVLKDASAAAIYGSRAANGVIIITTKKGKAGEKGKITYDAWLSVANSIKTTDVLTGDELRQAVTDIVPERAGELGEANTDWQDELLQTAIGHNHALSFTGGAENIGYRASIGYLNQEGILKKTKTERTSLSFNYNHRLFDDQLKIDANLKASGTNDNYTPNKILGAATAFDPTQPILDETSQWGGYFEYANEVAPKNPVAELNLTQDEGKSFRSLGNIQFNYQLPFLEGLSANLNLGYDIFTGERKRFLPTTLRSQSTNNGEVRIANFTKTNTLLETYLKYSTDLESIHSKLDITAGYSYQNFVNEYPESVTRDLSSNIFGFNNVDVGNDFQAFNTVLENRLISFFGRANFALMDKYIFTATLRRDGSSRFSESNRWALFPSAAVAWRISDEAFMGNLSFLSDLKLRAGWGVTGNQEIGDFKYLKTFKVGDRLTQYQFGDEFVSTIRPDGFDETLKWEETTSYNIGLDYGFWKGRITGSLEYYYKKTKDLLFEVTVPTGTNLTNRILTNIGSLENQGVEFSINTILMDKEELSWNVGFNIAYNKNKILSTIGSNDEDFVGIPVGGVGGGTTGNTIQILQDGQPAYAFYVYKHKLGTDGRPLTDNVDHNEDGSIDLADMYEDTNGDGSVTSDDLIPYKQPAPNVTLGLSTQLYVKNFDVNMTLRGNLGNYVYNNIKANGNQLNNLTNNTGSHLTNVNSTALDYGFHQAQLFSDQFVENASFVRLDNVTLGYTFSNLKKVSLRLYATAQNLFVITDYTGLDPEIGNTSGKSGEPTIGIDNDVYPRARTFIFGLNIGL